MSRSPWPASGGLTPRTARRLERRHVPLQSGPRQRLSPRAAIPQVSIPGHIGRELVQRPELIEQLISVLLAKDASGPAKVVSAVHGVGGIGKTTLVGQACSRMKVQANFTGGVLWIAIGETATGAELARRVNDLVERLTGARPSLSDPEQAGFRLGEALDAHEGGSAGPRTTSGPRATWPFLLGGHSYHRLITTRNRLSSPAASRTCREDDAPAGDCTPDPRPCSIPSSVTDELVRLNFQWPVSLELTNQAVHRAARQEADIAVAARHIAARLRTAGPRHGWPKYSSGAERHTVTATIGVSLNFLPSPGASATSNWESSLKTPDPMRHAGSALGSDRSYGWSRRRTTMRATVRSVIGERIPSRFQNHPATRRTASLRARGFKGRNT